MTDCTVHLVHPITVSRCGNLVAERALTFAPTGNDVGSYREAIAEHLAAGKSLHFTLENGDVYIVPASNVAAVSVHP